jgi:phage shock protein A
MTEIDGLSSDLIRILAKLTDEVERFDSTVVSHRKMLEHLAGHLSDLDNDQFTRQAERLTVEAAEMVACAHQALEQLHRLAEPSQPFALRAAQRSRSRGVPIHRRTP